MSRKAPKDLDPIQAPEPGHSGLVPAPDMEDFRGSFAYLEAAPAAILVVDESGSIVSANEQALRTFRYPADELHGAAIEQLVPARSRIDHLQDRTNFMHAPKVCAMGQGRDLSGLRADGQEFPVEVGLSPISWKGRTLIIATVVDLTARKRLERGLVEANQRLEEFCRVASHDLKTPLRGVASLVEWLEDDLAAGHIADATAHLERIRTRVLRMEYLLDELLAYADAGTRCHALRHFEPQDLIGDVVRLQPPPAHIELRLDIQEGAIDAAWAPLHTVLRNLLSNAYKHHDLQSGAVVEIEVRQVASFCEFAVRDNGPGVPREAHDRVFQLFRTLAPDPSGSNGIGLALAKRLVLAHGGRISLDSNEPARGITVRVWWPRVRRADYERTVE